MKKQHAISAITRKPIRNILLLSVGLLVMDGIHAQEKKMVAMAEQPVAMNMTKFRSTPEGVERQKKYGTKFAQSGNGVATRPVKYGDGSILNIKLVKDPSFGGEGTNIKSEVKKGDKPEKSKDAQGNEWSCSTDHVQLTATSTTFLNNDYSGSSSHIYPGAIYTYENFYDGSYKEQQGDRNPLTIITDNTNIKGKPYVTVDNPNTATIRAAVDDLFKESKAPVANESLAYQVYETSTLADESLKISGGVAGYGAALTASYHTGSSSKTRTLTIDAIKTLFSINTIPPKGGFFKSETTEGAPDLMVIGSVSYGVRVLANLTFNFTSDDEAAAFSASYSGWGISANVDFDQISKNQSVDNTINCYIVGGPGNSTVSFNKKDLKKEIEDVMSKATYKNAMPVKYEFYDMAGAVIGSNSATDSFAVRQCTPANAADPKLVSVLATIVTGNSSKDQSTNYDLYITTGKVSKPENKLHIDGPCYKYKEGPTSTEYQEHSSVTRKLLQIDRPLTMNDFRKDGGAFVLQMWPHGSNEWDISKITLALSFEGSSTKPIELNFSNLQVSNDSPYAILYFDKDFSAK
jgi:hypothetical protein